MKKIILLALFSLGLLADPFTKGSTSVGIKLGSTSSNFDNYVLAGVSGNYFVIDNLSVGGGYEYWFDGRPTIQKITLESTYFIPVHETVFPYIGVLYRHSFIDSFNDLDSLGYRAGLSLLQDKMILSVGIVQEKNLNNTILFDDVQTYVELIIGSSF